MILWLIFVCYFFPLVNHLLLKKLSEENCLANLIILEYFGVKKNPIVFSRSFWNISDTLINCWPHASFQDCFLPNFTSLWISILLFIILLYTSNWKLHQIEGLIVLRIGNAVQTCTWTNICDVKGHIYCVVSIPNVDCH